MAAIRSAQLGASVALVEQERVGGVCLNKGCIPTKTLVENAKIIHEIKKGPRRGVHCADYTIDMAEMIRYKDGVCAQLSRGVVGLLASNSVDVYYGTGVVGEDKTVRVGEETIGFDKLIIAIGSSNFVPPIEGADHDILSSTELLELTTLPESLAIIGGGVIGCEFATVFSTLGTRVTIIEKLPSLLPNVDREITELLHKSFKRSKVDVKTSHEVQRILHCDGRKIVIALDDQGSEVRVEAEQVLMSVGRKANTRGIEALALAKNRNFIQTNEKMETNIPSIYAIGDVTGTIQLAHVASAQGIAAAENAMGGSKYVDLSVVPSCIFTLPEIASVGLSEEEAVRACGTIKVGRFPAAALGKAVAIGETEGLYKIIADGNSGRVVGVHLFGTGATDIIMEAAVAMRNDLTIQEIADTIHAHPTLAEGVMEAAHDLEGVCIHLPRKKVKHL